MVIQSQKDIEEYICFSFEASKKRGINFSQTEKNINYKDDLKSSSYDDFLDYGILHYQVARILFFHHLINYSFLSAHQAIENILKAYLKLNKSEIYELHDLFKLLERCKSISNPNDGFLFSKEMEGILTRFNPFYEAIRYPVSKNRPFKNQWLHSFPSDIFVLDYFVKRMFEYFHNRDLTKELKNILLVLFDNSSQEEELIQLIRKQNIIFCDKIEYNT